MCIRNVTMVKHERETSGDTPLSIKRSKKQSNVCESLKEALALAESSGVKIVSFQSTSKVFERIRSFRVATVVYVSRLPSYMWDATVLMEKQMEFTDREMETFSAFSAIMEVKCCRQVSLRNF